jgi:thymidylate synthase (FAD)
MENKITFRTDMTVELIDRMGGDESVVRSARVSTSSDSRNVDMGTKEEGLINYLMRDRHGSPFEHNAFTFFIEAPIFVFREFMRHRIASYNEESGRYKQLEPVFYVPGPSRNLVQAYEFSPGGEGMTISTQAALMNTSADAYEKYLTLIDGGVAREVARMALPVNIYSSMYVTMNARSLMNFLSLRTKDEASAYPSFPQREIEMVAEEMEKIFAEAMPLTHGKFVQNGRVAP